MAPVITLFKQIISNNLSLSF